MAARCGPRSRRNLASTGWVPLADRPQRVQQRCPETAMRGEGYRREGRSPERNGPPPLGRHGSPPPGAVRQRGRDGSGRGPGRAEGAVHPDRGWCVWPPDLAGLVASTIRARRGSGWPGWRPTSSPRPTRCAAIWAREPLAQLQAATPGRLSWFVVLDGDQLAVATTGADPDRGADLR